VGTGEGGVDVLHVEEEKSRLSGARLDGFGGELGGFDLVQFFFADGAFYLFVGDGKWQGRGWIGVGFGIGKAAGDIVGRNWRELGAARGSQFDLHVGDGDGLVTVVGDDEEDGQEPVLVKVDGKYFCLVGGVVGVGGDGHFLFGMVIVRGIRFGWLGYGLDEILGRKSN
jgi:hypothetical protein